MKKIFATLFLSCCSLLTAQKLTTRNGILSFEASMPTFEEIAATNQTVSSILETSNGDLVVLALVKSFKFKSPLMEEHFNENYVESSRFPKATFKGKIKDFTVASLSNKKEFELTGELNLHGVSKKIATKVEMIKNGEKISIKGTIYIQPKDYNIEIPNLVKNKIAEKVKVVFKFTLE